MNCLQRFRGSDADLVAKPPPQHLVDEKRFNDLATCFQHLHQQCVAPLAQRREPDELTCGSLSRGEFRSAEAKARSCVAMQRAPKDIFERPTPLIDPRRLVVTE